MKFSTMKNILETRREKEQVDLLVGMLSQAHQKLYMPESIRKAGWRKRMKHRNRLWLLEESLVFDAVSDLMSFQDLDYNVLFGNKAAAESIKEAPENLIGRKCYEIWYRRKNPCGNCLVPEALRFEEPQAKGISAPDGRIWSVTACPFRNKDMRISTTVGIVRSAITERKEAQEALHKSEEKYRMIVENSLQGIAIVQDFKIVYANKALAEISGYTVEELLALSPEDVRNSIHPEDQAMVWERFSNRIQGEPAPSHYELRGIGKDRDVRLLEMIAVAIEYEGKPAIQAVILDLTEKKKAEELKKRVKKQRETYRVCAGSVGHELRNTLSRIRNSSYYLKQRLKDSNKALEKHLSIIEKNVAIANDVISDLLDPFKARDLQLSETDISSLIEEILADSEMPENISVKMAFDRATPRICLDQELIRRALRNLITNAVQAMPDGGSLEILCGVEGGFVLVQFKDNGEGISGEDVKRVFEPSFTTRQGGSGLGLAIVEDTIERHKGIIQIESSKGKGTTVALRLPILTKSAVDLL